MKELGGQIHSKWYALPGGTTAILHQPIAHTWVQWVPTTPQMMGPGMGGHSHIPGMGPSPAMMVQHPQPYATRMAPSQMMNNPDGEWVTWEWG